MDKFKYKDYEITVHETGSYNPKSAYNQPYANIIETEKSNYKKYIEMRIELYDTIKYVLLIVSAHTLIDSHSCIALHDNGLFMMLNSVLCVFNPETLDIDQQTRIDPWGTMFDVYTYKNDYILYGETDIYRVSSCLDIMWRFSARDIFVRYRGDEPAFEMKEDRICLYDFLDNYYEIDYNGKIICEKINES